MTFAAMSSCTDLGFNDGKREQVGPGVRTKKVYREARLDYCGSLHCWVTARRSGVEENGGSYVPGFLCPAARVGQGTPPCCGLRMSQDDRGAPNFHQMTILDIPSHQQHKHSPRWLRMLSLHVSKPDGSFILTVSWSLGP